MKDGTADFVGSETGEALLRALSPAPLQKEWRVPPEGVIIGRDAKYCDVVVSGATISRRHCRITRGAGGLWRLDDMASTNGVYVNGKRIDGSVGICAAQVLGLGQASAPDFVFYPPGEMGLSRQFRAPKAECWTLGRAISADISLPDDSSVSLFHAELLPMPHGLEIRDTGSRNGTWIDGQQVHRARVHFDSVVLVGNSRLRFELLPDQTLQVHVLGAAGGIGVQVLRVSRKSRSWRGGSKLLLDDVCLVLEPGSFTGILGPSGAGKAALLQSVNGYMVPSDGEVLYNDIPLHGQLDLFRSNLGYVPQGDIVHVALTVYLALEYIARLRLPRDVGIRQRGEILRTTLETLRLSHVCDIPIERLSAGQRKRVSIAAELITRPGILLLDEPALGLNSESRERFISYFGALASAGRTIVMTSDGLDDFSRLDRVAIMACGKLCFFGTPDEALEFFSELDPECRSGQIRPNRISEFLAGGTASMAPQGATNLFDRTAIAARCAMYYRRSDYYRRHIEEGVSSFGRRILNTCTETVSRRRRRSVAVKSRVERWRFFPVLAERHWRIRLKGTRSLIAYMLVPLAMAIVTLSISELGSNPAGSAGENLEESSQRVRETLGEGHLLQVQSLRGESDSANGAGFDSSQLRQTEASLPIPLGILLMFTLMATFTGTLMACLELSGEREVFRRERMAGLSATVYVVSKLPFLFALTAVQCVVFVGICFISPELRQMSMVALVPAMIGTAWAACALGLLISALDPTPGRLSVLLAVAVVLPQLVLSGALAPDYYAHMSPLTQTLSDLSPARWGFEMLLSAAFDDSSKAHWAWIGDLVRDKIGFLFGGGVYFRATLVLTLLSLVFLALAIWRVAASARPR